ncbi:MAG TPA: hypothetical protein VGL99_23610 [Chloroflexota bacterium]
MSETNESRQLQDDSNEVDRIAESRETASTERVYAPASARVPKPPAPGHEALVQQVDSATPERRAAEDEKRPMRREHDVTPS